MYDEIVYPSDNELGIPVLREDMQATHIIKPCYAWGSKSRLKINPGMWHFYTDDYRFNALFRNPQNILETQPKFLTELNISLYDDTPPALALTEIFKKRWMSRYFQEHGIKIFVDLYVPDTLSDWNLLGVPSGWKSYTTRGKSKEIDELEYDYGVAVRHRGSEDLTFVVFGGGSPVADWCKLKKVTHLPYKFEKEPHSKEILET